MPRYPVIAGSIPALLVIWVAAELTAQPSSPTYYVRIVSSQDSDVLRIEDALLKLGFQPDKRAGPPSELWGRLPAASFPAAEKIAGVHYIVIEPTPSKPILPQRYQTWFRIRLASDIRAPGQRYTQYRDLVKLLQSQGFQQAPLLPQEWRYHDILRGEVPASAIPALIDNPLIRTILLVPTGVKITDAEKTLVFAEIWLGADLRYADQQLVWKEASLRLAKLGFLPATRYDNEHGTRLLGWLPTGSLVKLLETNHELLSPSGNDVHPLNVPTVSLFRVIEVLGEPGKVQPAKLSTAALSWPEKITPDAKLSESLRALLHPGGQEKTRLRLEVIFPRSMEERQARAILYGLAPSLEWEGHLGAISWVRTTLEEALAIASSPEVSTVRLPQAFYDTGTTMRHGLHYRYLVPSWPTRRYDSLSPLIAWRDPVKVAIIGNDFRGWEKKVGQILPHATYYLDYTRWMNEKLDPEPFGMVSDRALAVAEEVTKLGAVEEMYLVRIHESAPYQVGQILERITGLSETPQLIRQRHEALRDMRRRLEEAERELRLMRSNLVARFRENDPEYIKARDAYLAEEKALELQKNRCTELTYRLQELQAGLDKLRQARTAIIVPRWREGYSSGWDSPAYLRWWPQVSRDTLITIQVVPSWTESDWFGWLRDDNGNEAVEFRRLDRPEWVQWRGIDWQRRRGAEPHRWGHAELNWLAWRPASTTAPPELKGTQRTVLAMLPAKTTVELTLQWKEVHDPRWSNEREDVYRRPLTTWMLEVLQPRAEAGNIVPEDVYNVVAYSQGLPERVENHPRYSIYEMRLRFSTGDQPGRYAVRLRGRLPQDTSPSGSSYLQGERQEVWFRLSAELVEPVQRQQGQVVWLSPSLRSE